MPTLTELPCEIIAAILKSLYDVQSLAHCLLTCRHLHLSMKEYPGVAISIVQQQVTPLLLPYAVCLVEVSDPATFDPGSPPTKLLGMLLDSPAQLADRLHLLDFRRLVRISYMHSLVEKYAFEHARDAWTILSQRSGPDAPTNLSLSSAESFRFCRAFYRLELISVLCCKSRVAVAAVDRICGRFFSRLPPWEIGQLGCAHDFLDKKFLQGSFNVLAHDVDFGEAQVDYLLPIHTNDMPRRRWLSQGLQFIDIVCQDGDCSYEKQRVILKTVFESRYWDLLDLLENSLSAITWGYLTLAECTDEQLNVMLPPRDPADLDPGPRLAWFDIMANDQYDAVILPCHAGVRECAFVMWDASRIHQFGLLPALESMPASPTYKLDLNDPAYLEMVESWKSRDAVSSDGGSGYWSRGDNSRLVYPPVFVSRLPRT